ncbi:Ribonuclease E [Afipia felis]|uniref:Ribonuclease E n=1 Tax=Afipia felis TaxID=1035 RepID=A0A090MRC5_AFIFE|nr:ribonuclease E/G [Afipia felis]CEG08189.1 Ribonuclease E [Afipia felis]
MPNKMLIDATHPEETRVVVVRGNRVEEFDFESAQRKQLRGNIYLAKVTRVEPSLQAAFIEYGGNRHGFLAFSEIHPDYYQIPVADRQALIEADERAHREAEEENENRASRRRSRHRNSRRRDRGERVQSAIVEGSAPAADAPPAFPHDSTEPQPFGGYGYDDEPMEDGVTPASVAPSVVPSANAQPLPSIEGNDYGDQADESIDDPFFDPSAAAQPEGDFAHHDDEHDHDHDHDHASDDEAHDDTYADHEHAESEHVESPVAHSDEDEDDDEAEEEEQVESVGGDDALEEVPERAFRPRRQYKIQEVIKRRQVMLVQVVKEERGNKGAALTTYLSLAGRYAVLMPNTARGGGISRKITSAQDRNRLKDVVQDLDVPEGMGIILRTAGASRTKPEIKRDFEYLIRMWETVRDLTLKSQAPTLVYEEGSLIKRSLRDLYNKEIDEVLVSGDAGYQEARDFMKMLMPSSVRAVKPYRDTQPLFSRMGVESQLDAMFSPTVTLRSGGYIVINQTEALVSIDVNSGRSTREHHIEDTALKTNLEAAEEVARQLRLRDLAGLIVIDFIDMDEKRNNRAVERKMSDCLRQDRARIQVGRISHFGLLEMSRQRIRASVLESSTEPCPTCGGTGHVRSVSSVALQLLRSLEEQLMKSGTHNYSVRTRTDVALYVLNHKRGHLRDLEEAFQVTLSVIADTTVNGQQAFIIERGEQVHTTEAAKALLAARVAAQPVEVEEFDDEDEFFEEDVEAEAENGETADAETTEARGEGDEGPRRRRRRRRGRGRGGEGRDATQASPTNDDAVSGEESQVETGEDGEDESDAAPARADQDNGERRPRRRGRRGGRRRRGNHDNANGEEAAASGNDTEADSSFEPHEEPRDLGMPSFEAPQPETFEPAVEEAAEAAQPSAPAADETPAPVHDEEKTPRRSTVREKVSFFFSDTPAPEAPAPVASPEPSEPQSPAEPAPSAPRRMGWWSRRSE